MSRGSRSWSWRECEPGRMARDGRDSAASDGQLRDVQQPQARRCPFRQKIPSLGQPLRPLLAMTSPLT
ncbi:hypothetical protein E2C01_054676 [Portunus trituberculatus]|uniref:Uncharacterized protein n=1 Tax=Portunus trituberculatus TaxID=210409 RepID=A0A5B7GSQ2_PORTR|nr:hypothetical protein [Portunus trituberculatus]